VLTFKLAQEDMHYSTIYMLRIERLRTQNFPLYVEILEESPIMSKDE
jgi:hypothetical protein